MLQLCCIATTAMVFVYLPRGALLAVVASGRCKDKHARGAIGEAFAALTPHGIVAAGLTSYYIAACVHVVRCIVGAMVCPSTLARRWGDLTDLMSVFALGMLA